MRVILDTSVRCGMAFPARASYEIVESLGSDLFEIAVSVPLVAERPLLPDPNDDMVVEVAIASRADFIVMSGSHSYG